ncbi:MAG: hypothetical protein RR800_11305, partial [Comamonas sp.]
MKFRTGEYLLTAGYTRTTKPVVTCRSKLFCADGWVRGLKAPPIQRWRYDWAVLSSPGARYTSTF